jgi:hypothetical protein
MHDQMNVTTFIESNLWCKFTKKQIKMLTFAVQLTATVSPDNAADVMVNNDGAGYGAVQDE